MATSKPNDPLAVARYRFRLGSIVTPGDAAALQALASQTRLVQIAGAGYSIRREQSGRYVAAVRDFLASAPK